MFLDTFISEENDGALHFSKTIHKVFYFVIQIRLNLSKTKKIFLVTLLATFPSSFLFLEPPKANKYFGCIMWMLLPRLTQDLFFLGYKLTTIVLKTTEQPAQLQSEQ